MKREIKFRAQRIYSEEWNYFDLGEYLTMDDKIQPDMLQYLHRNICQFTGLTDKNGKEIYEGDIVKALTESGFDHGEHKGELFEVYFFVNNGGWYIKREYREYENMNPLKEMHELVANCDLEIIGNIYENPELL